MLTDHLLCRPPLSLHATAAPVGGAWLTAGSWAHLPTYTHSKPRLDSLASENQTLAPAAAPFYRPYANCDTALAALLLVPGLPAIAALVALSRLTSRGPGIYRQTRVGHCGKTFTLYKIRSMTADAEAQSGPVWAATHRDPRVTRLGRFLRASHLDELPQLFNVLKGEMALVGPRPERPEFTEFLADEIPDYMGRLTVKPGITGLAQINLPPDTDLPGVRRKLALDLEYIMRGTPLLNAKILLCTGMKLLGFTGHATARTLGLLDWPQSEDRANDVDEPSVTTEPRGPRPLHELRVISDHVTAHRAHSIEDRSSRQPVETPTRHAFTVDVEDYYQVTAFEDTISRSDWPRYESRVVANTHRILDLLDRHDTKATFFVLGWVAQQHPALVQEIDDRGHEIGSHSFWHRRVYQQTPNAFRDDLIRSRDVLSNITGRPVTAYRAPCFSVTRRSLWALDILAEEGFLTDSSIFPIRHDRYGIPDAPATLHRRDTASGPLWEFPPAVIQKFGANLPVGGGGYFRLAPYRWTRRCLDRQSRQNESPFIFYIHPWEVDPDQPRIPVRSRSARLRHYVNLNSTLDKLDRLLTDFSFDRMDNIVAATEASQSPKQAAWIPAMHDARSTHDGLAISYAASAIHHSESDGYPALHHSGE